MSAAQGRGNAPGHAFDVVVVGAGAGGMTAAIVAANHGLRTLLIERSAYVGGTTALSSGTTWIPGNHHSGEEASRDTSAAREYLRALIGERRNDTLLEAFLHAGPRMLKYMETRSAVRFHPYAVQPDYRQELPGATLGGRALEPLQFNGRLLKHDFQHVRPPIPELTLFGGMMITRAEAATLLRGPASMAALSLGIPLLLRHARDRLEYARGTRLVLGNALVARLYRSVVDAGVTLWREAVVQRLIGAAPQGVTGMEVLYQGRLLPVGAAKGVILAGGGFPASAALRERYLPKPTAPYTPACPECRGDTIQLALDAGAAMGPGSTDNALWFPSSVARRKDGSSAVYPHIVLDRAKPGLIAVNKKGQRFCNEALSYHEFTRALYQAHTHTPAIPAALICDRRFLWKYGLGIVRPHTLRLTPHIKSGYLKTASTLAALAAKLSIDADGLQATVARHNHYAVTGHDQDFHKGDSAYDRSNGDAQHKPNPCIGKIERSPFYAVEVYPTPLGTSHGLAINAEARVLDPGGTPIPGLYACGNDIESVFSGEYPGPGAQIGPAMTFGYVAACHLAAQAAPQQARHFKTHHSGRDAE